VSAKAAPSTARPEPVEGQADSVGYIKHNRLEVFEEQRYKYDTHGNLIEKKIGRHTIIQLEQSTVTPNAAETDPKKRIVQVTSYQYDAFGRRISKRDQFGETIFTWDGNRLLHESRGSRQITYLYEPRSFAPLAQIIHRGAGGADDDSHPRLQGAGWGGDGVRLTGERDDDDDVDTEADLNIRALQQQALKPFEDNVAQQRHQRALRALSAVANDSESDHERTVPLKQPLSGKALKAQLAASPDKPGLPGQASLTSPLHGGSGDGVQRTQRMQQTQHTQRTFRIRCYQNDRLGTPRELTDESGTVRWAATYKTWGNVATEFIDDDVEETFFDGNTIKKVAKSKQRASVRTNDQANNTKNAETNGERRNEIHQPLRFQGQYFDEETGLHYNRFRCHDPDVGRFVSRDPRGLMAAGHARCRCLGRA
jgi:RHS repeat-associated protein